MRLVFSGVDRKFDKALAQWILKRAGVNRELVDSMYYSIGVVDKNNQLIAGVLYNNYEKMGSTGKIELSMAADSPGWCRRGIIAGLLYYPFISLNCHIIISTVKLKNKRVRKLAEGIGFKVVGKINNWPHAEDVVIYSLRREDAYRWLQPREERKAA